MSNVEEILQLFFTMIDLSGKKNVIIASYFVNVRGKKQEEWVVWVSIHLSFPCGDHIQSRLRRSNSNGPEYNPPFPFLPADSDVAGEAWAGIVVVLQSNRPLAESVREFPW